jgi:hypothetical protein
MSYEELCERGRIAREQKDHAQWSLGIIASEVDVQYGRDAVGEWAKDIQISRSSAYEYRAMRQFYGDTAPIPDLQLAYSHYRTAKRLGSLQLALSYLEKVRENNWTVETAELHLVEVPGVTPESITPLTLRKIVAKCVSATVHSRTALLTFEVLADNAVRVLTDHEYSLTITELD